MLKKYKARSLIEFQNEFPDDEACAKHIVAQRWPDEMNLLAPSVGINEPQSGGLKVNTKGKTSIPGLYAGGDCAGTNFLGHCYPTFGFALLQAVATGAIAGVSAAEYAGKVEKPVVDEKGVAKLKETAYSHLHRESGFSPDYVMERLQQTILPFDILLFKHGKRLEAALIMVEHFRDDLIPKMWAVDIHNLAKAIQVRDSVLVAEMILRASLLRTESRGETVREDYPYRDDENWLAWTVLKEEGGKMKVWKEPIPEEYWPDKSIPYEKRYTLKYRVD